MRAMPRSKRLSGDFVPCHQCRARHLGCDGQQPKCQRCYVNGFECDRRKEVRFRYGIKAGKRPNFVFPCDQAWVPLTGSAFRYHDETSDLKKYYDMESFTQSAAAGTLILYGPEIFRGSDLPESGAFPGTIRSVQDLHSAEELLLPENPQLTASSSSVNVSNWLDSPISANASTVSSAYIVSQFEPFTNREAELMRNFTENMAQWADVTDIERHFEIEIPRRALTNRMLRFAIFAFSSRHLSERAKSFGLTEALEYHNQALQLLIPQLSGPDEELGEEVFAAVLILRLDEEWHEYDNRFHLQGATRILNSISSFISSGGLGEAAAWLCLRQDIAISVISQQPLKICLKHFNTCRSIQKDNDISWALKMVLLLSLSLTHAFLPRSITRDEILEQVKRDIQTWQNDKPVSYEPIKIVHRSKERGNRIPVLWMLSPFHVLGEVYYHMARIVLLTAGVGVSDESVHGAARFQHTRAKENSIREHLVIILGLAQSNPRSQNTLYSATHSLTAWGGFLRHRLDQEAAMEFLQFAEKALGWKMRRVLAKLQKTWNGNGESNQ